jgi:eukaryotic-like serine/threonine-protein kinase
VPKETPARPAVGDVVAERYRLVREIAQGGMAVVFEAVHVRLRQRVALKVLLPDVGDREATRRFELEARVSASLQNPNVVHVVDVDRTESGLPFMAMELLVGRDLQSELDTHKKLPVHLAVDIAMQVCDGMAEAHGRGVVHRDLKPPNVFLCELGPTVDRRLVKVLDFGISKVESAKKHTTRFDVFGTPYYMSPEHVRSAAEVDARSDIWSLGVLLFEMLTGRLPFEGTQTGVMVSIAQDPPTRPTAIVPELPPSLEAIVLRCLAKNPWERFSTMEELRAALAPFGPPEPMAAVLARAPRQGSLVGDVVDSIAPGPVRSAGQNNGGRRAFFTALAVGLPLVVLLIVGLRITRARPSEHAARALAEPTPSAHAEATVPVDVTPAAPLAQDAPSAPPAPTSSPVLHPSASRPVVRPHAPPPTKTKPVSRL